MHRALERRDRRHDAAGALAWDYRRRLAKELTRARHKEDCQRGRLPTSDSPSEFIAIHRVT